MARNSLIPFGVFGATDPIFSLHREMNRLFDDVLRSPDATGGARAGGVATVVNANMNVSETDRELRVTVELPGVTEQDLDISLHDDLLTIRGEKKLEARRGGEKENFHYVERSYGSFQRSLRLPFEAKPEDVTAEFRNGVLTVTVPKTTQPQRSHRIQIQGERASSGQGQIGGQADQLHAGGQPAASQPSGAQTGGAEQAQEGRMTESTQVSGGQAASGGSTGVGGEAGSQQGASSTDGSASGAQPSV